ncbi:MULTISPECIES: DNA primase [Weeksella]|uniref:DNA primase n=1 Tax=Weeksella virosa (strain ATCC 43766 / DSM 16922 / JCM 21250 / CCUG 30538 / CDC 9751 / IAM 14551 / NBRC 16016 / NCTC 11634 / CL345/78) TaxID=865938 RepID=F0P1D4_WEEVC|nr:MULTISPECIES: DNA primase [Weeksella]ADX68648.1 DNA primase [Weeksella virosa DSM 16922]MDK7375924.1 DNA primase [Weeksella virosa]MDK7675787.1 DNA primase [Weeksella virosa]OFM85452.1 DNA primase [Weeksella sp. HMSC059D05]SUP54995.1 DNA primase [Weeksella virosa]
MITQKTIDEIFDTARVEEVIGDFVQLKRAGANLKGLSPFANEKTPSFVVSPGKQIWKDFSSGRGGNVVTFLMEIEQFSYPEALRWLAKKYNIEVEEDRSFAPENNEAIKNKESLFLITEAANKFFQQQLHQTEEGISIGLSYFKERGFTKQIIEKFQLGYSPSAWDAFANFAEEKGYAKNIIEQSGLVIYKEDKKFDRFRERVIFPIFSYSGRTLGFGGRVLRNDRKNAAKYLNSPENEIYHKSKVLYGLYQSKQSIIRQNQCLLVEGYTDVLALHQAGIENVVSSSGTALTKEQILLIKRLTPNITILYDGDAAGIKASFRGIDLILEQEMNVRVLLFPDGQDPDSFAKNHTEEEIKNFIDENATDFIQFKAKILMEDAENDPIKKAELTRNIVESIALIPNLIQQEIYIEETAKLMQVSNKVLFKELAQYTKKINQQPTKEEKKDSAELTIQKSNLNEVVDPIVIVEEKIIQLILQFGDKVIQLHDENNEQYETTVIEEVLDQLEADNLQFQNPFYQKILDDVIVGYEKDELRTSDFFIKIMDEEITNFTSQALISPYHVSKNWKEKQQIYIKDIEHNIDKEVKDTLLNFKSLYVQNEIKKLLPLTQSSDFEGEVRIEILEKIMRLTKLKNYLNHFLNRVV